MQLWIAHPAVATPPAMPDTATADVTLRRMQQFKVELNQNYTWQVSRDGHLHASGEISPDAANLLTVRGVALRMSPIELSVKSGGQ